MIEHQVVDGVEGKTCNTCGRWLPLERFYKSLQLSDGLQSNCGDCKRRMQQRNRESVNESSRRSYAAHKSEQKLIRAERRKRMCEEDILNNGGFARRYWNKVKKGDGCWNWQAYVGPNGYGQIGFSGGLLAVHRVAWILANGLIPDDLYVCHHCDNRTCCNPAHLFLGTFRDNMDDMLAKGRHGGTSGERHPQAKLTREIVDGIRRRYKEENIRQEDLGAEYGVSKPTVSALLLNKTWHDADYEPLPKRIKMSGPNNPKIKGDHAEADGRVRGSGL
jgi:hypothetical protein